MIYDLPTLYPLIFLAVLTPFEHFFMPTANLDPKSSPTPSSNISQPLAAHPAKPSRWQLAYDTIMMVAIGLDLLLLGFDALMLSSFMAKISSWLGGIDKELSIFVFSFTMSPMRLVNF